MQIEDDGARAAHERGPTKSPRRTGAAFVADADAVAVRKNADAVGDG